MPPKKLHGIGNDEIDANGGKKHIKADVIDHTNA
jgi:hypothetical protein